MKLAVRVTTPQEILTFSCEAHHTALQHERLIESEFYEERSVSHTIPIGDHHELELDTPVWEHVHAKLIHWHQNRSNGRYFVCVTTSLPTLEDAKELFEIWCLGTAYTMITGEDFNPLVQHGDMARFRKELKSSGIEVVKEMNHMSTITLLESVRVERRVNAVEEVRTSLVSSLSDKCFLWQLKGVVEQFPNVEWLRLYAEYALLCLAHYSSAPLEWQQNAHRGLCRDLIALIRQHIDIMLESAVEIIVRMEAVEQQHKNQVFIHCIAQLAVILNDNDRQLAICKSITASSLHVSNHRAYEALTVLSPSLPEATRALEGIEKPLPSIRLH